MEVIKALESAHTGEYIHWFQLEEKVCLHSFQDNLAARVSNMREPKVVADSLNRILVTSQVFPILFCTYGKM